jgi:transcriptional regulator with XRE-family HTH domain
MPSGKRSDRAVAETLGRNLARRRKAFGISQEELAFRAELHRTAVGQIERGLRAARADTILRLSGSLEITTDELFEGLSWTPGIYQPGQLVVCSEKRPDPVSEAPATPGS